MQRPILFLIIGIVVGVGAGVGIGSLMQSHAPKDTTAEFAAVNENLKGITALLQSLAPKDATAELAAFHENLKAGEVQNAYDALLAAMRVAPGDEKVFDASLEFVRQAAKTKNDEAVDSRRTFISVPLT